MEAHIIIVNFCQLVENGLLSRRRYQIFTGSLIAGTSGSQLFEVELPRLYASAKEVNTIRIWCTASWFVEAEEALI